MIEDYNIDLYYVEKIRRPDGTGGFEYAYKIGDTFRGTAIKSGTQEQTVAGIRGVDGEQYTITTYKNNVLEESDVIMFRNEDNNAVFLRVNSPATYPPNKSSQSRWKYTQATRFEPDLRVVE